MAATVNLELGQLPAYFLNQAGALELIDFTPALKRLVVLVSAATIENFAQSRSPDGVAWIPLKRQRPTQGRAKKRGGGSDKPLLDERLLMGSVTSPGGKHVERITPTELTYGTNLEYAGPHQWGHTFQRPEKSRAKPWVFHGSDGRLVFTRRIRAHKVTIPARPFLGWNDKLKEDTRRILDEYVQGLIRKPAQNNRPSSGSAGS